MQSSSAFPLPPLLAAFGFLLLLAATPNPAPSSEEAPEPASSEPRVVVREGISTFEEAIDVHLVNVEVFVNDRRGQPVRGLTVEDFVLEENGRPMEITHFSEATGGSALGSVDIDPEAEASAPAFAPSSVLAPAHLVIFVDGVNIRAPGRRRAIENLRAFLAGGEVDSRRVLIVAQKPQLATLAPFGSTFEELDTALVEIENTPALGYEMDRERDTLLSQLRDIYEAAESTGLLDPCEELANAGQRAVASYSQRVRSRVGVSMRHLATLSSALAGVPGNKIVLYVSDGLELRPGLDFIYQLREICPGRERDFIQLDNDWDLTSRFNQLTRHANANRVSLYTIDAMGHRSRSTVGVEANDLKWTASQVSDQVRIANLQNSLSFMANDTGGRSIFGLNDISDELEGIGDDMSNYYSLAYSPDHQGDDRVHVIDVSVKGRKKLRVRHRLSYRDKPSEERMADRLQTALTLGIEENPLNARLTHGVIQPTGERGIFSVPLHLTVPLGELVFLSRGDQQVGALQLQVMARDAEGRYAAFHTKQFEVELDASLEGEARGLHTFVVDVEMRGGEHVVAVGIRDATGRSTSYLASKLRVAATPSSGSAPEGGVGGITDE